MLAHLDPNTKSITLISFPRDLWVPIAGTGHSAKINSAFEAGKNSTEGAKTLIHTIENNYDVRIDHYVEVDFEGFKSIVNTIGGVNVNFDYPARDFHSGLYQTTAGCVTLYGDEALSYVRSRYYQEKINGRYVSDPRSDLGRIERQQDFIKRVAARTVKHANGSAFTAEKLVRNGIKYVKLDNGFGLSDLVDLAKKYRKADPMAIKTLGAVPGTLGRADGQSVILPDFTGANAMLSVFRSNGGSASDITSSSTDQSGTISSATVSSVVPSSVHVKVLNGSGVQQQASQVSTLLKSEGFSTAGFGEADTHAYTKTVIRYNTGEQAKALFLQKLVKGASVLQQADITGADIEIVTGTDFLGMGAVPTTTTSTTASTSSSSSVKSSSNSSLSSTTVTTLSPRAVGGAATKHSQIGSPSAKQCVA